MTNVEPEEIRIRRLEARYFRMRRGVLKDYGHAVDSPPIGLALSGGGIRSATLSLGVLTSLSRLGLVHRFDYLSTVSGGGYTGAFYGSLFTPPERRGVAQDPAHPWQSPLKAKDPLGTAAGRAAIRHLRENGRYLLPSGSGDALRLVTITIRAWLALQLVIGITLLAIFLSGKAIQATLMRWTFLQRLELRDTPDDMSPALWPLQWLEGYPVDGVVVLSPLWPLAVPCLAMFFALGWAFWLTRYEAFSIWKLPHFIGPSVLATAAVALSCTFPDGSVPAILAPWPQGHLALIVRVIGGLAAVALMTFGAAELWEYCVTPTPPSKKPPSKRRVASSALLEREDRVRFLLTGWATFWLKWFLIIAVAATIDTIAQTIYCQYIQQYHQAAALPVVGSGLVAAATPFVRNIISRVQGTSRSPDAGRFELFMRRFGPWLAAAAALGVAFVILLFWATLAQYIAWRLGPIGGVPPLIPDDSVVIPTLWTIWLSAIGLILLAAWLGISLGFLNLTTFSDFYASRLRRAYLGGSNDRRMRERSAVNQEDAGDDIALNDYYVARFGAPLHLINCTINETQGGTKRNKGGNVVAEASSLVQRDRKGRPLTLSPAGYLYPNGNDNNRSRYPFSDRPGIDLSLSKWAGISGAAISTGLGQNTTLGLALLAGLSNLRLGVWWTPPDRKNLWWKPSQWAQSYLKAEFLAKFQGIYGQRWYLTDGGHFENTGVYELVRRRVPLIVACDNGADPDYNFTDIVNLTRKLRIDFDANLQFLSKDQLNSLLGAKGSVRGMFGELSELVKLSNDKLGGPYAAIARITIPRPATSRSGRPNPLGPWAYLGTLILLKPRMTGLEIGDICDYHRVNPGFPQQSTGDQFFDEAQWESYYRLGATIADYVFAKPKLARPAWFVPRRRPTWSPADLAPIDAKDFAWFAEEWGAPPPQSSRNAAK